MVVRGKGRGQAGPPVRPGPEGRGLAWYSLITGIVFGAAFAGYAQLPAVRGDLLAKLGRFGEAGAEFGRAAALTSNERERALFLARAAECHPGGLAAPPGPATLDEHGRYFRRPH